MSLFIQGVGAVSPLGPNATTTWAQLLAGNEAPRKPLPNGMNGREYYYVPVPEKFIAEAGRQPPPDTWPSPLFELCLYV